MSNHHATPLGNLLFDLCADLTRAKDTADRVLAEESRSGDFSIDDREHLEYVSRTIDSALEVADGLEMRTP